MKTTYLQLMPSLNGVPRANKSNKTLEIDFAMATDCDPGDWVEKPDAVKQWKDI